ncbi:MAG: FAD binding domain-containing protein [Elusimicrobiales bacterium]|nr:FAD binding domain-containing protein [Elusimicrobiales bacterium]
MTNLILNEKPIHTEENPGLTLLEFVRDISCLSGTKDACREGECGACTVLVGSRQADGSVAYKACASCLLPLGDIDGCHVVTVEGLGAEPLTLVQRLIVEHSASQCGFCTPGIVLSLTGFALGSATLSYEDAVNALDGNICRCTGYASIRNAARALCEALGKIDKAPGRRLEQLVAAGVLPRYFLSIPGRLAGQVAPAAGGKTAVLVAGGTDLLVQKPEQLLESELCFLSRRRDLDYVREDKGLLRVGGAVTIEDFRNSAAVQRHFPALTADLLLHSSAILRNKATLAGNIVNASPIGDATIILLALGANLTITGENGKKREIPLDKFYLGYKKTDLACGELVSEISFPLPPKGARYNFEKVSNRTILDIAAANSALLLAAGPDGAVTALRVSAGGVGPVPMLLPGLEKLHGRKPDAAFFQDLAAAALAAAKPIDDIRGSAEYKRLLLGQLMLAHGRALAPAEAA